MSATYSGENSTEGQLVLFLAVSPLVTVQSALVCGAPLMSVLCGDIIVTHCKLLSLRGSVLVCCKAVWMCARMIHPFV